MIKQVFQTTFMSIGIAFICELFNIWLSTTFLHNFLNQNLVTILVALLAINATTMGIVLTKIRDLVEKQGGANCFTETRSQMMLSIKEQITLIIVGIVLLTVRGSAMLNEFDHSEILVNVGVISVFCYALFVLYDTARSVLIIVDFDG